MTEVRRATIRADASALIGTGHVSRCLTLGLALVERGWEVGFVASPEARVQVEALVARRSALPVTTNEERSADLVIVDHYALGAEWERRQRATATLVIDDLADRPHACDLLLDQNLRPDGEAAYRPLVPPHCRLLLGPSFALLRGELIAHRTVPRLVAPEVVRALVSFGGSDPTNQTERAVTVLRAAAPALTIDVLIGSACPYIGRLKERFAGDARVELHIDVTDIGPLYARVDLAIGAGGVSLWERACLGVPSICLAIAANQVAVAQQADHAGVIRYLGEAEAVTDAQLQAAIEEFVRDAPLRQRLARAGQELVDGGGAARVVEAIEAQLGAPLAIRCAKRDDARLYFDWANDPVVRAHSFHKEQIAWEEHLAWFERKLCDPHASLYVAERRGVPAAQVRFDIEHERVLISLSIAAHARGKRLGSTLLRTATDRFFADRAPLSLPVEGVVHCDNRASRRAFLAAGFVESNEHDVQGIRCVSYRLPSPHHTTSERNHGA